MALRQTPNNQVSQLMRHLSGLDCFLPWASKANLWSSYSQPLTSSVYLSLSDGSIYRKSDYLVWALFLEISAPVSFKSLFALHFSCTTTGPRAPGESFFISRSILRDEDYPNSPINLCPPISLASPWPVAIDEQRSNTDVEKSSSSGRFSRARLALAYSRNHCLYVTL